MILGENLGTTSTANIAALVTGTDGKRAALAHTLFNLFGLIWALPLLPLTTNGICSLFAASGASSPCTVPAATKAWAVEQTVNAEISEAIPATIMRRHADAILFCDPQSAQALLK